MHDKKNGIKKTESAQSSHGWYCTEVMLTITPWDSRSKKYFESLSEDEDDEAEVE